MELMNSCRHETEEILNSVIGKVIIGIEDLTVDSDKVIFTFKDGTQLIQYHEQDCCEGVFVSQVDGDVKKHLNATVTAFKEKVVTNDMDEYIEVNEYEESATATFYTLVTNRGYLDWRWQGGSNGNYSERVDLILTKKEE